MRAKIGRTSKLESVKEDAESTKTQTQSLRQSIVMLSAVGHRSRSPSPALMPLDEFEADNSEVKNT